MEQASRFTREFSYNRVQGFCMIDGVQLQNLKDDLALSLSPAGLLATQQHFRRERRDPLVGELRFLGALAERLWRYLTTDLTDLHFESSTDARIWQDICRQRAALSKGTAPMLSDVLQAVTVYLARAGRVAPLSGLFCADAPTAAACGGALLLDVDGICAALTQREIYSPRAGDFLMALSATNDTALTQAIQALLKDPGPSPTPVCVIGEEGLGVHLGGLPFGAELDLTGLPEWNGTLGAEALATACRHTALFAVPEAAVKPLLSKTPLVLVGRLQANDYIVLKEGVRTLLSLPRSFLATWTGNRHVRLTVPHAREDGQPAAVMLAKDDTRLLAGARIADTVLPSLLSLLERVLLAGGDPKSAVLGAAITLPPHGEAEALSLALPYHRFAAELALPTASTRIIVREHATPTLTVFLSAPKCAIPDEAARQRLKTALCTGDFRGVREAIYSTSPQ